MLNLPKIYPLTDSRITNLSPAEQCRRLIEGGAELIQIREKYALSDEFYKSAKEALEVARKTNTKIIINDRVDIALALRAGGVHLGQDDLPAEKAREILGQDAFIGLSTHSVEQAKEALELPVDYIAIGPIFVTKTKENPDEVVGLGELRKVREAIGAFPLVAIGGINFNNYKQVLEAGADSVAMISDLLRDANEISQTFAKFNQSL